jgi:hypothetical protein
MKSLRLRVLAHTVLASWLVLGGTAEAEPIDYIFSLAREPSVPIATLTVNVTYDPAELEPVCIDLDEDLCTIETTPLNLALGVNDLMLGASNLSQPGTAEISWVFGTEDLTEGPGELGAAAFECGGICDPAPDMMIASVVAEDGEGIEIPPESVPDVMVFVLPEPSRDLLSLVATTLLVFLAQRRRV